RQLGRQCRSHRLVGMGWYAVAEEGQRRIDRDDPTDDEGDAEQPEEGEGDRGDQTAPRAGVAPQSRHGEGRRALDQGIAHSLTPAAMGSRCLEAAPVSTPWTPGGGDCRRWWAPGGSPSPPAARRRWPLAGKA